MISLSISSYILTAKRRQSCLHSFLVGGPLEDIEHQREMVHPQRPRLSETRSPCRNQVYQAVDKAILIDGM